MEEIERFVKQEFNSYHNEVQPIIITPDGESSEVRQDVYKNTMSTIERTEQFHGEVMPAKSNSIYDNSIEQDENRVYSKSMIKNESSSGNYETIPKGTSMCLHGITNIQFNEDTFYGDRGCTNSSGHPVCEHECLTCGKTFKIGSELSRHCRTVHTVKLHHLCQTCGKRFNRSDNLRRHLRLHTGELPFKCETCGKRFVDSTSLKNHQRVHTIDRPFGCSTCGKKYILAYQLQAHLKTHLEQPCPRCDLRFPNAETLQIHKKTHVRVKLPRGKVRVNHPQQCEICGKVFGKPFNLQRHLRTHTGERPYECTTCDKRFADPSTYRHHCMTHTGNWPFKCVVCEKGFRGRKDLQKHETSHLHERTP